MTVRVEGKGAYKFNTGKAPKGFGRWMFEAVTAHGVQSMSFTGTFAEAQQAAKVWGKKLGVTVVRVMS